MYCQSLEMEEVAEAEVGREVDHAEVIEVEAATIIVRNVLAVRSRGNRGLKDKGSIIMVALITTCLRQASDSAVKSKNGIPIKGLVSLFPTTEEKICSVITASSRWPRLFIFHQGSPLSTAWTMERRKVHVSEFVTSRRLEVAVCQGIPNNHSASVAGAGVADANRPEVNVDGVGLAADIHFHAHRLRQQGHGREVVTRDTRKYTNEMTTETGEAIGDPRSQHRRQLSV